MQCVQTEFRKRQAFEKQSGILIFLRNEIDVYAEPDYASQQATALCRRIWKQERLRTATWTAENRTENQI